MPYVRVSFMRPRLAERAGELQHMLEDLLQFFKTQPGFVEGYLLKAMDGTGRLGRLTVWESDRDAGQAAQHQHVMAVRSRIRYLTDDESDIHLEAGFEAMKV